MKDLIIDNKFAEQIEIICEQRKQQEYKKIAEYRPIIDGGTIFCYDRETKVFSVAKFRQSDTYHLFGDNSPILDIEPNKIYVEALNESNALKRLKRGDFAYIS